MSLTAEQIELLKADAMAAVVAGDMQGLAEACEPVTRDAYRKCREAGLSEAVFVEPCSYLVTHDPFLMLGALEHLGEWIKGKPVR